MVRTKGYDILKELGEKSRRGASSATAMLVSGRSRLDAELRHLRQAAGEEYTALCDTLVAAPLFVGERCAMLRLGGHLCAALEGAAESAVLLRGRAVRAWGLFDRVRCTAALAERVRDVVTLCPHGSESAVRAALHAFCEQSARLSHLSVQSHETLPPEGEREATLALSASLDRWRAALCAAFSEAAGLAGERK